MEDSKMEADGIAAKRRPSRPLKLDSEGEEQVETSEKEESLSDREEDLDEAKATQRLSSDKVRLSNGDGFANIKSATGHRPLKNKSRLRGSNVYGK